MAAPNWKLHSIVEGAGAVVVGEIPEFRIAAGIPARVLRDRRQGVPAEMSQRGAGAVAPEA